MFGILMDWIKDIKYPIECKHCDFKSYSGMAILFHIKGNHGHKPTKRDIRFVLKYDILPRLIKFVVACVLIPPIFIIKFIFCFLGMIGEDIL